MVQLTFLMFLGLFSVSAIAAPLIDDGIVAAKNAFPTVVKITTFIKNKNQETPWANCSGTLIAPNFVLTAAHCLSSDKTKMQRVSLVGDSTGKTEKSKGGIRVLRTLSSSSYDFYDDLYNKNLKRLKSENFERLDRAEKQKLYSDIMTSQILASSYDIAFLELEKNQVFKQGKSSALGCRSVLTPETEVTIAGYGRKAGKTADLDLNQNGILHYGSNKIKHAFSTGYTYTLSKINGKQLTNFGDSGGPLFKKNDNSTVYGVTSAGYSKEGRSYEVEFANLSSPSATEVYKSILAGKNIPKSLVAILKKCVE